MIVLTLGLLSALKMSSVVICYRRLGALMQVLRPRWVRRLCQRVSNEESLPSNNSVESSNQNCEMNIPNTDISNVGHLDEDNARIVRFINTASQTELSATRHISSNMATRILSHREENGPYSSVTDLLHIPGIGRQILQRICQGILKPSLQVDVGKGDGSRTVQIGIAASRIEYLKDVVAVDMGLKHLSWVHMSRDRWVRQWRVKDIVGITAGKWDPPTYLKVVTKAIAEMPSPDLYVLQHKSYANANKSTFPMFLFQRTLESMLYASLNHDIEDTGTLRAISMPQMQIGRHFNLQVRGVRMSGQEVVTNVLQNGMDREGGVDLPARMTLEVADIFQSATKYEKEHLSNCLLQAIAFYDLLVDKN